MPKQFTPLHITIFLTANVGTYTNNWYDNTTKIAKAYELDLIQQGLIHKDMINGTLHTTAYGNRKLKELLIKLGLPGEEKE